MSSALGSLGSYYMSLSPEQGRAVAKSYLTENRGKIKPLSVVIQYINSKDPKNELTSEEKSVLQELDTLAKGHLCQDVALWKERGKSIEPITHLFSALGKGFAVGTFAAGAATAWCALSKKRIPALNTMGEKIFKFAYCKKRLAILHLCGTIGLAFLAKLSFDITHAIKRQHSILNKLTPVSYNKLEEQVQEGYREAKKANFLIRYYLSFYEKNIKNAKKNLFLLKMQVDAASSLKNLIVGIMTPAESKKPLNSVKAKEVFAKLVRIGNKGKWLAALLAGGFGCYIYVAQLEKSRFFLVVGMVGFLVQIIFFTQLRSFEADLKFVSQAKDREKGFTNFTPHSRILSKLSFKNLNGAGVQYFALQSELEHILQMIPSFYESSSTYTNS